MTLARYDSMRAMLPGWRVRMFHPASDVSLSGRVSEVNDENFRLGADDGRSYEFDYRQAEKDHWDIIITDRTEGVQPEVLDRVPSISDDPDAAVELMTTTLERPDGYDQHDSEVARSLEGAHHDDEALADAERDNDRGRRYLETMTAPRELTPEDEQKIRELLDRGDRLVGTICLPLENRELGLMLVAFGETFPGSYMKVCGITRGNGYEQEIRVYLPVGGDDDG